MQPLWHSLRNELVSQLIPVFLANHPNSGSVLHYVWHGQVSILFCTCYQPSCQFYWWRLSLFSPTLCIYWFDLPFNKLKAFEVLVFQFLLWEFYAPFCFSFLHSFVFLFANVSLCLLLFFFSNITIVLCFIVKR